MTTYRCLRCGSPAYNPFNCRWCGRSVMVAPLKPDSQYAKCEYDGRRKQMVASGVADAIRMMSVSVNRALSAWRLP